MANVSLFGEFLQTDRKVGSTQRWTFNATAGEEGFTASFMKGELSCFARDLRALHEELKGEAILAPIEPNLELSFIGDGKGHIEVKGTARNQLHTGTKLSFRFDLDQTFLPAIMKSLMDIDS